MLSNIFCKWQIIFNIKILIKAELMDGRVMDTGLNSFFPQKNHQTVPVYTFIKKYGKDMIISEKT